jgi:hypothetical protein
MEAIFMSSVSYGDALRSKIPASLEAGMITFRQGARLPPRDQAQLMPNWKEKPSFS